ncbi:N-acetylmuramoyl-L-alanine amidase [Clostridium sp. Marseille-Q2269]|uniref:N-acetylmuramoyl-L-alanine amidase n=1 Tax=Clostridium sp. Marseille-Q2269 TaxID=2942205 RepID=UPI002073E93E|nr:N-acetylmuramoyl-L-alanine amidase [Clostridium sp. Marseille-Q2269]
MNIINNNLNFRSMDYGNSPNTIVLHHAEDSKCTIQDIHSWHLNNGWSGCGYHYFVRKDGSIYKGRPDNAIGAHCPGMNDHSIGICAEGAYMSETMPQAQKNAIIELGKYLKDKYGITKVGGHREYYSTDCPGTKYPLGDIKNAIISGSSSSSSSGSSYNVKEVQTMLIKIGYPCGSYGSDGVWGSGTQTAVTCFQKDCNLKVTGVIDSATYNKIKSEYNKKNNGPVTNKLTINNNTGYINLDGKTGYINTPSGVNVRESKSTSARILGALPNGTKVQLYRKEGDWIHIYYPPHGGYVYAKYIKY